MQTRQAAASAALASWNALQPELLVLVAGECNAADMCSMMGSCVEWRDALQAQEPRIWERLLHQLMLNFPEDDKESVILIFLLRHPMADFGRPMTFDQFEHYLSHGIRWLGSND